MTQKPAWATALHRIRNFTPDALVVSLGVDSFAGDRVDWFELQARITWQSSTGYGRSTDQSTSSWDILGADLLAAEQRQVVRGDTGPKIVSPLTIVENQAGDRATDTPLKAALPLIGSMRVSSVRSLIETV